MTWTQSNAISKLSSFLLLTDFFLLNSILFSHSCFVSAFSAYLSTVPILVFIHLLVQTAKCINTISRTNNDRIDKRIQLIECTVLWFQLSSLLSSFADEFLTCIENNGPTYFVDAYKLIPETTNISCLYQCSGMCACAFALYIYKLQLDWPIIDYGIQNWKIYQHLLCTN